MNALKNKLQYSAELARHFGLRWLMYRLGYALKRRSGWWERRLPAKTWEQSPFAEQLSDPKLSSPEAYWNHRRALAPQFFFQASERPATSSLFARWQDTDHELSKLLDEFANGKCQYFSKTFGSVGNRPQWHTNPFTHEQGPTELHWSRIDDFGLGDIKVLWEPSRFSIAFALVRAYWRTGDNTYPEMFWKLVESWRLANPPQRGVNWKCGQEASVRMMAWCFALYGFADSPASTAERVTNLAQMIAVSATRIEANIEYSLSQLNNHGIAESLGLWTAGLLFPELKSASRWKQRGRELLERQARELIYTDGGFSQNSVNYHRVMVDYYLWCIQLGRLNGEVLSEELVNRFAAATHWLAQIQDEISGGTPNYGHNDGALVLPLTNCDYADYRPMVQAANYLVEGKRALPPGAWDEELVWLFGKNALEAEEKPIVRNNLCASDSGYYILRSAEGFLFTRCGRLQHRPAHADFQHVDIWWRGINIACDPGTFSYNAPPPWHDGVAATEYHNAVTIDGQSQMERKGRWIWLPWATGQIVDSHLSNGKEKVEWLETSHDGYRRLSDPVEVRRSIVKLPNEHWLVLDRVVGHQPHKSRLHWLLADANYEQSDGRLVLHTTQGDYGLNWVCTAPSTFEIVQADSQSPRGWRSPYYQHRMPAISLAITAEAAELTFATVLGPDPCTLKLDFQAVMVDAIGWSARATLSPDLHSQILLDVTVKEPATVEA